MLALALILGLISLGLMCRALFALAVNALPFSVAVSIGFTFVNAGSGVGVACLAGFIAGVLTLVCGRVLFAVSGSVLVRSVIAAAFLIPAAIAGRQAALGLALLVGPLPLWREIIGWSGALLVCCVALRQLLGHELRPSCFERAHDQPLRSLRPRTLCGRQAAQSSSGRRRGQACMMSAS
ncbi:conserved membrane protein of unknown function [Bradyrhizobium sp. ORS 285]|nr:conserved membrane hypothetical protein [Bradyrhizobium sp. ORS 285]SMX61243.1 conserved membrane protein of unknown function [Bradyrhizobium sp. ORS 285]